MKKTYSTTKTETVETTEYGNVLNSNLVTMFGSEMTYDELNSYAKTHTKYTVLKVEKTKSDETHFIRVWFDNQIVLEKVYACYHCNTMMNELDEYGNYLIRQEERDREEYGCYYNSVCCGEVVPDMEEADVLEPVSIENKEEDQPMCCFCGNKCLYGGSSPEPLAEKGVCCDECNSAVIFARLGMLKLARCMLNKV